MNDLLSDCFYYATPFQKLERLRACVPSNVPPFHMERSTDRTAAKLLFCNKEIRNVPSYKDETGAIRSTPHSSLGSVWKLLGLI